MQIGKFMVHLITPTPPGTLPAWDGWFAVHASTLARAA